MNEKELLVRYLPSDSVDHVYNEIIEHKVHLKITKNRKTKLGDYRPPVRQPVHRISINHNLNPYAFLITFLHELAHLRVFEKYSQGVRPHGKEWKHEYRELIEKYIDLKVFPEDLQTVLQRSIGQSRASSTSDIPLSRALLKYDTENDQTLLENIPPESFFLASNGIRFKKGEKRRTRYRCLNTRNNRIYLFHPLTPVNPA